MSTEEGSLRSESIVSGRMRFTKHHGAGNDFLVAMDLDDRQRLTRDVVRALCDRHLGVGADGVIRVLAGGDGAALTMELWNADGSRAEMSGNGIRCLAQAAVEAGAVGQGVILVATDGGVRRVDYRRAGTPAAGWASVDMGSAGITRVAPEDVVPTGLAGRFSEAALVDMGNPHLVLIGSRVGEDEVALYGPVLERSVDGGANVEFGWAGPGEDEISMLVWERGVGETLACVTGTCALAAVAAERGLTSGRVLVHNPGGTLEVLLLTGPADGGSSMGGIVLAGPSIMVAEVSVDLGELVNSRSEAVSAP
ncbi:MAG: diaminopimelate epimerase [Acidimicrobiales bacterium]